MIAAPVFVFNFLVLLSIIRTKYTNHRIILHGNFNINLLSVDESALCSQYISMMYSFNLIPSIVRPTRIAKNSFTLIDNTFINNYANFAKAGIVMTNISDHYAVFSVFRRNSSQSGAYVEFNRRIAQRENLERLKNSFADNDFTPVLGNENAKASYNLFVDNVRLIYDAICPAREVRIKRLDILKPYITSEIKELLRSKH